jgi:hypothetical protein
MSFARPVHSLNPAVTLCRRVFHFQMLWYHVSMIKLIGNDIWRGDKKIGWMEGNHVRDHDGKRLGYFDEKFIYNDDSHKVAYIEDDFLKSYGGSESSKVRLEAIAEDVTGGTISEIARAAIYILLGS